MYILESELPKSAYLSELKGCLSSPLALFSERMTGIVIGSFFSVAYYSPYEWDRRINRVCNRAWGWVKETEDGTEVRFVRGKGLFSPFWLVFFILAFWVMVQVGLVTSGETGVSGEENLMLWGMAVLASLMICGVTAIQSCVTERGVEGAGEITRMLRDPSEYYC